MRGTIMRLSIFILKWRKIVLLLLCIIVIVLLPTSTNYGRVRSSHSTNRYETAYTQKASVFAPSQTHRPLRIDDYEDMLRNMPTEECKCFKTPELADKTDARQTLSKHNAALTKTVKELQATEECTKRRFPRAMVIGMTKGGTTALMYFLNSHPGIAARTNYPLDTRYFSHYIKTKDLQWYRHLLPCSYSNQITIEKSTEYFFTPASAERVRKFDPKMKIIIVLKDPIVRALSQYLMWKDQASFRVGNKTFEQTVTLENCSKIDKNSRLIIVSNYQKHMKVWLNNFNLNQFLLVDGHKFVSNPADEINKVEDFLGIDRYFTKESFVYNSTKGKYCLSLHDGKIDCLEAKKGMTHPTLDTGLKKKLENYFTPLNELFFSMIDRRFDWGY